MFYVEEKKENCFTHMVWLHKLLFLCDLSLKSIMCNYVACTDMYASYCLLYVKHGMG